MSAQDFRVKNGLIVAATTSSGNTTITGFANVSGNTSTNNMAVATKLNVGTAAGFDFGTTALVELYGSGNTFVQIVIQNANSGVNASSDLVLTNDTGNDTFNYVDFGINSSTYSNSLYTVVGASDGYLYASNGALGIGTASAKDIIFHANGTLTTNEKMRISANGLVGIGTNAPEGKLHVVDQDNQPFRFDEYNDVAGATMRFRTAKGTIAGPTATTSGWLLGSWRNFGHNGTGFSSYAGGINIQTAELFTTIAQGTDITFDTTAIGAVGVTEKMRITASGNTGIGNTAPNAKLAVTGTANISGAVVLGSTLTSGNITATGEQIGNSTSYYIGNELGVSPVSNTLGSALGNTTNRWVITAAAGTFTGLTTSGTLSHTGPTGNYGSSTAAATYQLGYGATTTGVLKTINLGIAGAAGSTTNVNIGSTLSNTFVTITDNSL